MPNLLNVRTDFDVTTDGLAVLHSQEIPDDFLDELRSERLASSSVREREYMRAAAVPTGVIEVWLRQGRDFWNASARQIVQWLQDDGLDAFITTNKRL